MNIQTNNQTVDVPVLYTTDCGEWAVHRRVLCCVGDTVITHGNAEELKGQPEVHREQLGAYRVTHVQTGLTFPDTFASLHESKLVADEIAEGVDCVDLKNIGPLQLVYEDAMNHIGPKRFKGKIKLRGGTL